MASDHSVEAIEATVALSDGFEVHTKTWKATPEKARVLFLHGFSDHSDKHADFFTYLAGERGISIYSYDQRGWGRSCLQDSSHRGLTGNTQKTFDDISYILRPLIADRISTTSASSNPASQQTEVTTSTSTPSVQSSPVFLMGHSMGGGLALSYTSQDRDHLVQYLRGTIAQSPLIALHPASRPFAVTIALGRLASMFVPHRQLVNHLDASYLSRNPQKNQEWVEDELCHDTGTLEGLAAMLDRSAKLESGEWGLGEGLHEGGKTRVLVVHGGADRINECSASRRWVETACREVEDKRFWFLDGWFHNLHIEPEHAEFQQGVADWILERCEDPNTSRQAVSAKL